MAIKSNISYGRQSITQDDVNAVIESLESDWLTQGPKVEEFENALAKYCGSRYAIAVSNGTAALHLANLVVGTKSKTEVITTPITFLATPNSVIYNGGKPIFSDICNENFTINSNYVNDLAKNNSRCKGIIPVHLGGVMCDMSSLSSIAHENNLWIIEDACHALGGKWIDDNGERQSVGNCSHSDLTTFSFHPVKHITTGEGGAITTNNKELYEKLLVLRTHGMTKNKNLLDEDHGGWYYEMHELGHNFRMTDFQAALGIEQLKKSDEWVKRRKILVTNYDDAFQSIEQLYPQEHFEDDGYSYHLYIIQCENRRKLYDYLKANDIYTQVHYIPVHLQPFYRSKYGFSKGDFPVAENYYNQALSLPLYPSLTDSEQEKVVHIIKNFYEKN